MAAAILTEEACTRYSRCSQLCKFDNYADLRRGAHQLAQLRHSDRRPSTYANKLGMYNTKMLARTTEMLHPILSRDIYLYSPFSKCRCFGMSHTLAYPAENIGKIMRTPVLTIQPDESLRRAAQLMEEKNVGSIVVVQDSRPTGILTERDFVRLMAKGERYDTIVQNAMTVPVISCESDKKVTEAFVMMVVNKIDHLPITEKGKLAGIVAARDLLTATLI